MSDPKEIVDSMERKMGFKPEILHVIEQLDPTFLKSYKRCDKKLLSDGALSAKSKIFIALAVVASKQCESCVMSQMKSALHHGATKDEIMEVLDVIMLTSGAPAVSACRNALKLIKE